MSTISKVNKQITSLLSMNDYEFCIIYRKNAASMLRIWCDKTSEFYGIESRNSEDILKKLGQISAKIMRDNLAKNT